LDFGWVRRLTMDTNIDLLKDLEYLEGKRQEYLAAAKQHYELMLANNGASEAIGALIADIKSKSEGKI
jgi:hypothetical protein